MSISLQQGEPERALALYTRMIKSRQGLPRHVLAVMYSKRAVAFGEMKKHDMAIQDYTVALNMDASMKNWSWAVTHAYLAGSSVVLLFNWACRAVLA
jgi:hypothetical protein